jgi:hypothetical protein
MLAKKQRSVGTIPRSLGGLQKRVCGRSLLQMTLTRCYMTSC